jgi:hypothetical protein
MRRLSPRAKRILALLRYLVPLLGTAALVAVLHGVSTLPTSLVVLIGLLAAFLLVAGVDYGWKILNLPDEERAHLEFRFHPRHEGTDRYEMHSAPFDWEYRIGVVNHGPATAKNVEVQVSDAYEVLGGGLGKAKTMGYPFSCRRIDTDHKQIHADAEGLYCIGDIRHGGPTGEVGFKFDWQHEGYRMAIREGLTVKLEVSADNGDIVRRTLHLRGAEGIRLLGEVE